MDEFQYICGEIAKILVGFKDQIKVNTLNPTKIFAYQNFRILCHAAMVTVRVGQGLTPFPITYSVSIRVNVVCTYELTYCV